MKYLLNIVFLLPGYAFGQIHKDSVISLHLYSSAEFNKDLDITITKKAGGFKIVYTFRDSVAPGYDLYYDNHIEIYERTISIASLKLLRHERDSVKNLYSFYSTDSISFYAKSHTAAMLFFDQVLGAEEYDLKPPWPYVVADGTRHVSFKIVTKFREIKMRGDSPDAKYYPVLYKLIEERLEMGRSLGLQHFLAKEKTFWY